MTDIGIGFEIEGIEQVFSERTFGPTAWGSSRPEVVCIFGRPSFGESRFELESRRETSGGFECTLRDVDGVLRGLFSRDPSATSYLSADALKTDLTINMNGIGNLPSVPFNMYIGRETLRVTSKGASSVAVARGAYGSTVAAYPDGARAWVKPPSWRGRRITIYSFERTLAGGWDRQALWVGELDNAPRAAGRNVWAIHAVGIAESIANRPIYRGFRDLSYTDYVSAFLGQSPGDDSMLPDEIREQWAGHVNASNLGALMVSGSGGYRVLNVSSVAPTVAPGLGLLINIVDIPLTIPTLSQEAAWQQDTGGAFRPVWVFSDAMHRVVLQLLVSRLGDGDLGAFDVLPGTDPGFGTPSVRYGAGIPQSEIDVESFERVSLLSGNAWSGTLSQATTVEEVLREFCLQTRSMWYIAPDGRLTARLLSEYLSPSDAAGAFVIDDSIISMTSTDAVTLDEQAVAAQVTVTANVFDGGDPALTVTINDNDIARENPRAQADRVDLGLAQLSTRGASPRGAVGLAVASQIDAQRFVTTYRRSQRLRQSGYRVAEIECAWPARVAIVGTLVSVTNTAAEDYRGGTVQEFGLVIGHRIDPDGVRVVLRVLFLTRGRVIMPSSDVQVFSAGVLTVNTGDGDHFGEFQDVILWDPANNRFCSLFISTIAGDALTVDSIPAFTPAAGMFITAYPNPLTSGIENEAGYIFPGDGAWMASDDWALANNTELSRWS